MFLRLKNILYIAVFLFILFSYRFFVVYNDNFTSLVSKLRSTVNFTNENNSVDRHIIDVWCILTKVTSDSNFSLKNKFYRMLSSMLKYTHSRIRLFVIVDGNGSGDTVMEIVGKVVMETGKKAVQVILYDIDYWVKQQHDRLNQLRRYFTVQNDERTSYYSDALFFISLDLHNIAPLWQNNVIMLDVDIEFRTDIMNLHKHFQYFSENQLIGISPELSPVYRHVLYNYRTKNPNTMIGEPLSRINGRPGVNSGVLLLSLEKIRKSTLYHTLLKENSIKELSAKYMFKGHLGDQDFYTLLSFEYPHLLYELDCSWNRQLCQWWKHHGYEHVFNNYYAMCKLPPKIYHGNCDTPIPSEY